MYDPFAQLSVSVKLINGGWDTVSSTQLYRLYPHPPQPARQTSDRAPKEKPSPSLRPPTQGVDK
jgi:hypothetical protein